jgi:DNA-binding NarL/FixJ family response regulator
MIDILLVDDYAAVRDGLKMRLSLEPDFQVIGEACDGYGAINLAQHLSPHLIIMDAVMPDMDGLSAAAQMRSTQVNSEIIILTANDTMHVVEEAKAAGVSAVVAKDDQVDHLIALIRNLVSRRQVQTAWAGAVH